MADKQIKDLTAAGATAATDKLAIDNASNLTRYVTMDEVRSFIQGAIAQLTALDSIQFDTALATPGHSEGLMYWDQTAKTASVMTDITDVILQVGQEMHVRVLNDTGSQIDNGEAVYITGATGGVPTIALAQADAESTSFSLGLVTEDIADGDEGFATARGIVRTIDTSSFSAGNQIYLSPTVAGGLTSTKPGAPNKAISVGTVLVSDAATGQVLVKVDNVGILTQSITFSMPVKGVLSDDFNLVGERRTVAAGQIVNFAADTPVSNNHIFILVNAITGTGTATVTGDSISESTSVVSLDDTEVITIDGTAAQHYQSSKKWWEISSVVFSAGITAVNYDVGVVGYTDLNNENFELTGYRLDAKADGVDPNFTLVLTKIQDDGSGKMSFITVEDITADSGAVGNQIIDNLRTGGNDRSYDSDSDNVWETDETLVLKQGDLSTFFSSDENIFDSGSEDEGLIISFNTVNNVGFVVLQLRYQVT